MALRDPSVTARTPNKGMTVNLNDEHTRAWIYRVLTAALPILTFAGVLTDEAGPLVAGLIAAVFGAGLAANNTSTQG